MDHKLVACSNIGTLKAQRPQFPDNLASLAGNPSTHGQECSLDQGPPKREEGGATLDQARSTPPRRIAGIPRILANWMPTLQRRGMLGSDRRRFHPPVCHRLPAPWLVLRILLAGTAPASCSSRLLAQHNIASADKWNRVTQYLFLRMSSLKQETPPRCYSGRSKVSSFYCTLCSSIIIMERIARVVLPGIPNHITQRGVRSMDIFFSDADRHDYLVLLQEHGKAHGLSFLAWCLMSNHARLLVIAEHSNSLAKDT